MPRKRSPIFHRISLHLLRLSFLMHKFRKPIIPNLLVLLKKLRKNQELKLLRHYSYGEYQFSASSTPLIRGYFHGNQFKSRGPHRGLCSFLCIYWCLGNLKVDESAECHVETLPVSLSPFEIEDAHVAEDLFEDCGDSDDEEGESVDQKAERFIQSFYKQIRMQRQESL